jgi:hypothetical protein
MDIIDFLQNIALIPTVSIVWGIYDGVNLQIPRLNIDCLKQCDTPRNVAVSIFHFSVQIN